MDKSQFEQICKEMDEAIDQMRPEARMLHELQVGLALTRILDDYQWDWTYKNAPSSQIQAIKDADSTPENIQVKVPIWLAEWINHNMFISPPEANEQFVNGYKQILGDIMMYLPTHPSAGRLQRWIMARFDRQSKTFRYDA